MPSNNRQHVLKTTRLRDTSISGVVYVLKIGGQAILPSPVVAEYTVPLQAMAFSISITPIVLEASIPTSALTLNDDGLVYSITDTVAAVYTVTTTAVPVVT